MGFLQPEPPPLDLADYNARPYLARLKVNAQQWALEGFGAPGVVYLLYIVKLCAFVAGALLLISSTTPLGGLGAIGTWWYRPVVFGKIATWTLLWEILGLGSGSMPLTGRFSPMIGGVLYWLRPGTVRLPPWPGRVPLTRGYRRSNADVALYAGVLASGAWLLVSHDAARLDPARIAVLLGTLVLLGVRDKVPFLAARPEVYGFVLAVSLFPSRSVLAGWQFVLFFIWFGAASSKLNRHFPYVVSVMVSNTPWNRSRSFKAKLYRDYPEDLRPSWRPALAAHAGTAVEYALPLTMLIARGGAIQTLAVAGMVAFHTHILSTFPLGVPLEWNLFMIYGVAALFGHYGAVPLSSIDEPLMVAVLAIVGLAIPLAGNLFPDKISFLPAMRYYAGNWASSFWLFRKSTRAEETLDERVFKVAPISPIQLTKTLDRAIAEYVLEKGLAFRAMHSHGRALIGLIPRAVDDVDGYAVRDGETIAGIVAGWNFGDGHFHNHRLLEAVQQQCGYAPGDLRTITLESQPAHLQRQRYRIYDAAEGLLEEGWVDVAEMVRRGPWLEETWEFPVRVVHPRTPRAPVA